MIDVLISLFYVACKSYNWSWVDNWVFIFDDLNMSDELLTNIIFLFMVCGKISFTYFHCYAEIRKYISKSHEMLCI